MLKHYFFSNITKKIVVCLKFYLYLQCRKTRKEDIIFNKKIHSI